MASNLAAADMAQDAILRPRVALALVRHALTVTATPAALDAPIEERVRHGRSMALVARVLANPTAEGVKAQWAIAARRDDLATLWVSKGSAGLTDAQVDEAAAQVWDALTAT